MFSPWGYTGVKGAISPLKQLGFSQLLGLFAYVELAESCGDCGLSSLWRKEPRKTSASWWGSGSSLCLKPSQGSSHKLYLCDFTWHQVKFCVILKRLCVVVADQSLLSWINANLELTSTASQQVWLRFVHVLSAAGKGLSKKCFSLSLHWHWACCSL